MSTQLSLFDTAEYDTRPTPSLANVLEFLDSIWSINSGGCGVSALAIYRWSKQHESVSDRPFHLFWHDDCVSKHTVEQNDEALANGDLDSLQVPCHLVIELFNGFYDSTGKLDESDLPELHQEYRLNESELLALINDHYGDWNSSFHRAKLIPQIEQDLGIDLSDVVR